jgi:chromosome segregation ATPase
MWNHKHARIHVLEADLRSMESQRNAWRKVGEEEAVKSNSALEQRNAARSKLTWSNDRIKELEARTAKLEEQLLNEAQKRVLSWAASLYRQQANELAVTHGVDVPKVQRLRDIEAELRENTSVTYTVSREAPERISSANWAMGTIFADLTMGRGGARPAADLRSLLRKRAR